MIGNRMTVSPFLLIQQVLARHLFDICVGLVIRKRLLLRRRLRAGLLQFSEGARGLAVSLARVHEGGDGAPYQIPKEHARQQ